MARRGRPPYPDVLTPREQEVHRLLREGLSNPEIAERLGISLDGAKYHVSEILSKLGVASREEAAALRLEAVRPWWATAFAPLSFLWRKINVSWLSAAAAAVLAVAVAAGIGLLVWGLVRTGGDGGGEEPARISAPGPLSPPVGVPTPLATVVRRADGQIDFGGGLYGGIDWSPDGRSVAFIRNYVLYRAGAPDFEPYILVEDAGRYEGPRSDPRWSPDGSRIAFVGMHLAPARCGGEDCDVGTLWVVDADGSNLRDLLPGDAAILSVSTAKILNGWLDDRTLAFDEHCGTACQSPYILDVGTSALNDAAPELDGTVYHWSPDARWLAVADFNLPRVMVSDLSTHELTKLAPDPPRRTPWQWFDAWAPDSSGFLYEESDGEESNGDGSDFLPFTLHLWDVQREEDRVLATPGKDASWSQDGSLIAYVTEATPDCGEHGEETACIAVMEVESGRELYRVPGPGAEHLTEQQWGGFPAPVFLPDDRLLYATSQGEVRLAKRAAWKVLLEVEQIVGLTLSPDGRFIVVAEPLRLQLLPIPPS